MKNFLPIITAFIAIIGVLVGAGVRHFSSKSLEFERRSLEFRFNLYKDFVMAKSYDIEAETEEEKDKANRLLRESTLRLAIFAPKSIAVAVSEFMYLRDYPSKELTKEYLKDLALWHAMRRDAFGGDDDQVINNRLMAMLAHQYKLKNEE